MNKINKLAIIALSSLTIGSLFSCGTEQNSESQDVEDNVIKSIKIVDGSIPTSFYLNSEVDYSKLSINTLNKENKIIKTIKVAENKSSFTYDEIDTSILVAAKTFTLTYKVDDLSFSDSITYSVIDHEYEVVNWSANANYSYSVNPTFTNKKLSTSEDNMESLFLGDRKYHVGNLNSVNLLPQIFAFDENDTQVNISSMPEGVSIILTGKGTATPLKAEDYIENVNSFLKDGLLKFKGSVNGTFTLTLQCKENTHLKDIAYEINVVNGYNVTSGKDIYALANTKNPSGSYSQDGIRAFKEKYSIPDASALVFQDNVVFNKSDLADCFIWGQGENNDPVDPSVKGSFKDWARIIEYTFDKEGEVVVYGNSHTLALNDKEGDAEQFPYILTESVQGAGQQVGKTLTSHSAFFFGSFLNGVDPNKCNFKFQDLEVIGNLGVSANNDNTVGGPMFVKAEVATSFDNVNVSKFYMALMSSGSGYSRAEDVNHYHETPLNINNCRFHDSFNAAIYIYGAGSANITNSEMIKAGGPLIFLNPRRENFPGKNLANVAKLGKTIVNIDENSFFSNRVEGTGGWFSAYNANGLATQIKELDGLFNAYFRTSFLREENNAQKFNLLMVNLPAGKEGLGLDYNQGGVYAEVKKGNNIVYSTMDGYEEVFQKAYLTTTATTPEQVVATNRDYCKSLGNTFFGNNYAFSNRRSMAFFSVTAKDGSREFICPTSDLRDVQRTDYAILSSQAGLLNSSDVQAPTASIMQSEGLLATTFINNGDGNALPSLNSGYTGACNYGLLFADYHKI